MARAIYSSLYIDPYYAAVGRAKSWVHLGNWWATWRIESTTDSLYWYTFVYPVYLVRVDAWSKLLLFASEDQPALI